MARPYPWKCRSCGKQSVCPIVVDYSTEMEHDGRLYQFTVDKLDVLECTECHNRVIPDASFDKLVAALRVEAGLLTPVEIRAHRTRLGLTQKQLAQDLDIAEETLSRWERGAQIQQRAFDKLLRGYFDDAAVRAYYSRTRVSAAPAQIPEELAANV